MTHSFNFALLALQAGGLGAMAPVIFQFGAIFAIIYFLLIRPQQKQRKEHEARLASLKKGDEVVTAGGLIGEIVAFKQGLKDGAPVVGLDDRITLKTGDVKVVVERGKIARVLGDAPSEAPR
jgi:preprotein translocase subunit YajC